LAPQNTRSDKTGSPEEDGAACFCSVSGTKGTSACPDVSFLSLYKLPVFSRTKAVSFRQAFSLEKEKACNQ
jgi:hypothetical protein